MSSKNRINLTPAFCLHNKVVVLDENEIENICVFGIVHNDSVLKSRLLKCGKRFGMDVSFENISQRMFSEKIGDVFSRNENKFVSGDDFDHTISLMQEKEVFHDENEAKALLESIIIKARSLGATDIHIEGCQIRFRIFGKLTDYILISEKRKNALVQRIKLLAKMNVLEKRRCQDGSFIFKVQNENGCSVNMFVRVSSVPSISVNYGNFQSNNSANANDYSNNNGAGNVIGNGEGVFCESVVLRLLDPSRLPLNIDGLGFEKKTVSEIKKLCSNKDGLVLICGATGVGKSTTAFSMLNEIRISRNGTEKIISVEDPAEYIVDGITQIQVAPDIKMSFSDVLRSVFRQDPDVIFIGEVRDVETALVSMQAAMTGHLVFATLHASTVDAAISRMVGFGCNESDVKKMLRGIIVQDMIDGKVNCNVFRNF